MTSFDDILLTIDNGVARVTINRPEVYNAFRGRTVEELITAFQQVGWNRDVGVIVLTGAGDKAFCTGGDQSAHDGQYDGRGTVGLPIDEFQSLIRDVPKPVIARVNGFAIGGGNVLATLCDLTIASDRAQFGQVGPKVGSVDPGFGTAYLARVIGEKRARELWYMCRRYTAEQALQLGLINAVVPHNELDAEVERWCTELLARSPTALAIVQPGTAGLEPVLRHGRVQGRRHCIQGKAQARFSQVLTLRARTADDGIRPLARTPLRLRANGNMTHDTITIDRNGPIARLTLSRPPVNAIDDAFLQALDNRLSDIEASGDAVVIVRSDQRVFSAGADLAMVNQRLHSPTGSWDMMQTARLFHAVYDRLASLPALTIAEIAGHAMGGGLELALACDIRVATHEARIGLPEARVGLLPGAGGTQRLTQLCGPGIAARLILTGEIVSGRDAAQLGIVQLSCEARDLAQAVEKIAASACGVSPDALREAKKCIRHAALRKPDGAALEVEGIGRLMTTSEARDRVMSFLSSGKAP